MPWRAQGLDNLRWWCRMAGRPVVAIGGILTPEHAGQAAGTGADGVCVVRGLGDDPGAAVPAFRRAIQAGARSAFGQPPPLPHPALGLEQTPP
jgi:hydroxymethylpyrimidine kinase/phosphomethylpyrimidine kinase/thiamine-phosphate diphosphorylase